MAWAFLRFQIEDMFAPLMGCGGPERDSIVIKSTGWIESRCCEDCLADFEGGRRAKYCEGCRGARQGAKAKKKGRPYLIAARRGGSLRT